MKNQEEGKERVESKKESCVEKKGKKIGTEKMRQYREQFGF